MGSKQISRIFIPAFIMTVACCLSSSRPLSAAQGVVDLAGNAIDPLRASKGKITVLIFVRTDCPISNRYAPTIQRLSSTYRDKVAFWLVYPDRKESAEQIRKHDADFGYNIPAVRDPQRALVKLSEAQITPEAAVFDASGRLVYHGRIDNLYADFSHARKAPTTHELADAIDAAVGARSLAASSAPAVGCYIADLE